MKSVLRLNISWLLIANLARDSFSVSTPEWCPVLAFYDSGTAGVSDKSDRRSLRSGRINIFCLCGRSRKFKNNFNQNPLLCQKGFNLFAALLLPLIL